MNEESKTFEGFEIKGIEHALMFRILNIFATLAVISFAIFVGGRWLNHRISMDGYTDDTTRREIVIGNNVLSVPDNAIRFAQARRDGVADRLDLYLHWPDMNGYSDAARDDFNDTGVRKDILFLLLEPRTMSLDMSGRLNPIYRSLIVEPGETMDDGITLYDFKHDSGYADEKLAVAERPGSQPFVARCLSGQSGKQSLAACERDVAIGDKLTLLYRFPTNLLGQWRQMDAAVVAKAARYLKTAN